MVAASAAVMIAGGVAFGMYSDDAAMMSQIKIVIVIPWDEDDEDHWLWTDGENSSENVVDVAFGKTEIGAAEIEPQNHIRCFLDFLDELLIAVRKRKYLLSFNVYTIRK